MSATEQETRRLTPTERLHDIARTLAERPRQERTETLKVKQLSVGANAGKWICDELSLARDEDETDTAWVERTLSIARVLHAGLSALPHPADES